MPAKPRTIEQKIKRSWENKIKTDPNFIYKNNFDDYKNWLLVSNWQSNEKIVGKGKDIHIARYVGKRYGRLLIINKFIGNKYTVQCDCGVIKQIDICHIKSGSIISCGCYNKEMASQRAKDRKKHPVELTHPIYKSYIRLKKQFNNEICEDWKNNFQAFYDWAIENGWERNKLFLKNSIGPMGPQSVLIVDRSYISKLNIAKFKKTCLEKLGVDNPSKCSAIISRGMKTKLDKYGSICPNRFGRTENEIRQYLQQFGYTFNKTIIGSKEIDMYDSDLNLAIEYCGLHWHHEHSPQPRNKTYHYNKYIECLNNNIQLITIFEDEWKNRQGQIKGYLQSKINKNSNKIYARKCIVSQIDNLLAKEFLNKYHIQPIIKIPKLSIGIYYNNELLGVLSFQNHHRNNQQLVLNRLVFKQNFSITGGFSKMLKFSIPLIQNLGYNQITTWSDNRWSNGNVYKTNGFNLVNDLPPDYSYIFIKNPKNRLSKQSCKKSNISCPKEKTEREFMYENGFSRIWDCGKKTWSINLDIQVKFAGALNNV